MDNLRQMLATMSPEEFRAAARERELEEWRSINRFCGKCGSSMQPHANAAERALVCPKCGYAAYPKLSPAVIVLVTKGNKILLQRNTHYKLRNWTLVAGFVDAGENFEDAVRREVMEEASIEVKGLRKRRMTSMMVFWRLAAIIIQRDYLTRIQTGYSLGRLLKGGPLPGFHPIRVSF